jgi:hypothetical protein
MKSMIGSVFGWGPLVSLWANVDGAEISRPFSVIVVTVTDKTTGERTKWEEIVSDLRFNDRAQCELIVTQAGSTRDGHDLATVLTCRQIISI